MNSSTNQFGLMVAYLLPGFIGLAGIASFVPVVATWLRPTTYAEASLGPPIYAVIAATTIGMLASCFRWLLIDHIHERTGVVPPIWDDTQLEERIVAFNYLVESHYRYYQFVGNTLIAVLAAYGLNRFMDTSPLLGVGTDVAVVFLSAALFAASRDALSKYYTRTGRLVGQVQTKGETMYSYNGNDHKVEVTTSRSKVKPQKKSALPPKPDQDKAKPTASK